MKTINSLLVVTAVTLLLAATTALRAGPPPDLQNRTRPMVHESAKTDAPAKTDATAKTDADKIPALCAQMPNCSCAAMAAKNVKS